MTNPAPKETDEPSDTRLSGTTYKVYRYMLKQARPSESRMSRKGWALALRPYPSTTSGSWCG